MVLPSLVGFSACIYTIIPKEMNLTIFSGISEKILLSSVS